MSEGRTGGRADVMAADECEPGHVEVVVIGASTGGPHALEVVLRALGRDFPVPVLVAQHMPKLFTAALADRLNRCCALPVREAVEGMEIVPGQVLLAPGDAHMEVAPPPPLRDLRYPASGCVVRLVWDDRTSYCRPSVDRLFASAARWYGPGALGVVMTGMGSDGLLGSRMLHQEGGAVLVQDEATSAVWGMPGRVFDAGLVQQPLALHAIAAALIARVCEGRRQTPARLLAAGELRMRRRWSGEAKSQNGGFDGLL